MNDNYLYSKIDLALHNAAISWWEITFPDSIIIFSREKASSLGYDPSQFNKVDDFVKLLHPEDLKSISKSMAKIMHDKTSCYESLYRIRNKSGEYLQFYDRGQITYQQDDKMTISGVTISSKILQDYAMMMSYSPISTNENYQEVKDLAKNTQDMY